MNILAIETSGGTCGATVCSTSNESLMQLLATSEMFAGNTHDKNLALVIKQALEAAEMSVTDIDVVAVSAGPGSFTGLRIGLSLAKGLTYTNQPRLLLIDTLSALAQAAREVADTNQKSIIVPVISSHRDQFYAQRYHVDNQRVTSEGDHNVSDLMNADAVKEFSQGALVCGPGAPSITDSAISGLVRLSSRFIGLRACTLIQAEEASYTSSEEAEPMYRQEFKGNRP